MNNTIVYLHLLVPLLFLTVDSSSIRGRNNNNELVPQTDSRMDHPGKTNALKRIGDDPFFVQIQLATENEGKQTAETDKKREGLTKKRASTLKALRKKNRVRRDLVSLKPKHVREENKSNQQDIPQPGEATERLIKNLTKNTITRGEILKALSLPSKKRQDRRSGSEGLLEEDRSNSRKGKQASVRHPVPEQTFSVKMIYPSTPTNKLAHKYTDKDLIADRKRLEQKINYIKNMLRVNDSDDGTRTRRRSESDRTANKIAKMFLTLSAVNGLHEKRKPKCEDEYDEDGVRNVWEKERRSPSARKASSSNAERYKVKKWIEFMKTKRSSGKTCPCMANLQRDDSDIFPLEKKMPKDLFLVEKARSSEESSEYYNPREKPRLRSDHHANKLKSAAAKSGKKVDLPLSDLELYRSRAKQILQNAEEILDRIKEEEERRMSAPNILMSQLKELTSRIQSDPRSNENDLIRKASKQLGYNPLTKSDEGTDGNTFLENVKSYILDPYEKAKALTDESTKKLSSYLLRNLGKVDSEEKDDNVKVYFAEVPVKEEEKPMLANLAREDSELLSKDKQELQNWEDTLSSIMRGPEETLRGEGDVARNQEEIFKSRMEDMIKEQQKKVDEYELSPNSDSEVKLNEKLQEPTLLKQNEEERQPRAETGTALDLPLKVEQPEELLKRVNDVDSAETNQLGAVGSDSENVASVGDITDTQPQETLGEELPEGKHAQEEDEQISLSGEDVIDRDETDVLSSPHRRPAEIDFGPKRTEETPYDWSNLGTDDETPGDIFTGEKRTEDPAETILEELKELEGEMLEKEAELELENELAAANLNEPVQPVSLTDSSKWSDKQDAEAKPDDVVKQPENTDPVKEVSEESAQKTELTGAERVEDAVDSDESNEESEDETDVNLKSEQNVPDPVKADDKTVLNEADDAEKVGTAESDPKSEDVKSAENASTDQTLQAPKPDQEDTSEDLSDEDASESEEIVKGGMTSAEKTKGDQPLDDAILKEANATPSDEMDNQREAENVEEVLKSVNLEEDAPEDGNSSEDSDETPLQAKNEANPSQDAQNSDGDSDEVLPEAQSDENLEKAILESANPLDGTQVDEPMDSNETSEEVEMSKPDKTLPADDETLLKSAETSLETSDESQEIPLQSSLAGEIPQESDETPLTKQNLEESEEGKEHSGEALKAVFEEENDISPKSTETDGSDETLKATLENEKLDDDDEASKEAERDEGWDKPESADESTLRATLDDVLDETPKEAEVEESDKDETVQRATLDEPKEEQDGGELLQNMNEVLESKNEKSENDEPLYPKDTRNDEESEETPLRQSLDLSEIPHTTEERYVYSDEVDGDDSDENILESSNDSKIDSSLQSAEESYETDSEETLRAENEESHTAEDTHNQTEETEDALQSARLETSDEEPENIGENLILGDKSPNKPENSLPDLLQMPEQKTGKIKVPKSIGEIMQDLNGADKDDITSIENLNPDKIDHIIDKIDEAEHRDLLESQELDCRRMCACADDVDTRSRKMGRYEIARDFLNWMKDLQLNRVLSDN